MEELSWNVVSLGVSDIHLYSHYLTTKEKCSVVTKLLAWTGKEVYIVLILIHSYENGPSFFLMKFLMKFNSLLESPTANMNKLNYSIGFYCSKKQFLHRWEKLSNVLREENSILNDKNMPHVNFFPKGFPVIWALDNEIKCLLLFYSYCVIILFFQNLKH